MLQILVRRKVSTSVVVTTHWQEPILCSSKLFLGVGKTTGAAAATTTSFTTTTTTKRSFAAAVGSKIGRMLDMGGMPSASNDSTMIRPVNASKNCKLQAVAFDFDVLTKSFDESSSSSSSQQQQNIYTNTNTPTSDDEKKKLGAIQPDLDKINQLASLLQVNVDGTGKKNKENDIDDDDDDDRESESESSLLASIASSSSLSSSSTTTTTTEDGNNTVTDGSGSSNNNNVVDNTIPNQDIRAKYARKLQGGLAGLELAKSQLQNTLKGGDAAGHLAARKIALQETASTGSTSSTKWMALTGTGKLLSYLTHRSIRIALLPNPKLLFHNNNNNNNDPSSTTTIQQRQQQNNQSMKQFSKQLKDVVIDIVVDCQQEKDSSDDDDIEQQQSTTTTKRLLEKRVMNKLENIIPQQILIVSDSDEYLQAGRDLGMMTCRIRPSNARRGNITTNFTAKSIPDIQEVINEINGISFNAVLNR